MNYKSRFVSGFIWAAAAFWAHASVQLDIPPRLQWDNNNGYCGECSIQQIALYYGTYVSQYNAREIIDPTQQQDVWVPDNSGPICDALRLNFEAWDYRNDLASGSWTNLTNNVAGTGGLMTITDPGAMSRAKRFYRIFMTTP